MVGQFITNDVTESIYREYLNEASKKTKLGLQYASLKDGDEKTEIKKSNWRSRY